MNRHQPYIGITGIRTPAEMDVLAQACKENQVGPDHVHNGMMGLAVDYSALGNNVPRGNRYFHNLMEINNAMETSKKRTLNVIHYCSPGKDFSATDANDVLVYVDSQLCSAIQINGDTPRPEEIQKLLEDYPQLLITFSIHPELIAKGRGAIVETLRQYRGNIAYALIDPSLGEGKDINIPEAVHIVKAIEDADLNITPGFAGGFGAHNVTERIEMIRDELGHSEFSIDAETRLRTSDDQLDLDLSKQYIHKAAQALR